MNFIPYGKQTIDSDDIAAVTETLTSDFLTTGPKVKEFEDVIAAQCGAKYVVAVANGTAALHIASLALLKSGDKVLTTPNSFLATSNGILYAGAVPIFTDIGEDGNIDLDICEQHLKSDPSIKAVYAVAFSGNMLNQTKLKYLREKYKVIILEDCCHALGAVSEGVKAGSCTNSDCSIFSFHPVKHVTTGEGGAISTNSEEIYKKLLVLRTHGMIKTPDMKPWEYQMTDLGFNYRLTDIQSALGISQMKKLSGFIATRKEIAKSYGEMFKNTCVKPLYPYTEDSGYHLYVVLIDFSKTKISKSELFIKMREMQIGLQLHYIPINKQPYYVSLGYGQEKTPVMDKYYDRCLSLPMYPKLTKEEQQYTVSTLLELLNG